MLPSPGIHELHSQLQSHHPPSSPPSPPLPPPPPPPPLDSPMPKHFLRPIPVIKREDKFPSQDPTPAKRGGNQFFTQAIHQSNEQVNHGHHPPAVQVRRSLSMAKQQESIETVKNKEITLPKHNHHDHPHTVNTLSKATSQLTLRKPGNLFISQLYFLFHLSLVICVIRANGEFSQFSH